MILELFSLLLKRATASFSAELRPLLRGVDMGDEEAVRAATPEIAKLVREYREKTAAIANQLMADEAKRAGGAALVPPTEFYPESAVEKALRDSPSALVATQTLERHVVTAARRQVVRAVPSPEEIPSHSAVTPAEEDVEETPAGMEPTELAKEANFKVQPTSADDKPDERKPVFPKAWARVLTGAKNCPFCVMLASRGPVYSSASHAGRKGKGSMALIRAGAEALWGNSYHNSCDCMVVPVYDTNDWPGKQQADYLYPIFEEVTKDHIAHARKISKGNAKL